jgi:hypothetical protein
MSSSVAPEILDPLQSDMVASTTSTNSTSSSVRARRPPKFTLQIPPQLTVRPGSEVVIDVEVESGSPVK